MSVRTANKRIHLSDTVYLRMYTLFFANCCNLDPSVDKYKISDPKSKKKRYNRKTVGQHGITRCTLYSPKTSKIIANRNTHVARKIGTDYNKRFTNN